MIDNTAATDLALLVLRVSVGGVMVAHGWNHVRGGGRIQGTASWFGSLGMRSPRMQAWMASVSELAGGLMLVFGFLTPVGAAAVVGVMFVAWTINHRGNGFFIFRPGEGWEYVMILGVCGAVVGALGAGRWSLDHVIGVGADLAGWVGLFLSAGLGTLGAVVVLAAFWRPASDLHD